MNTNILKIIFTYSFILSNSVFRYWPLVSSHSAAKDSAKVPLKTIAVFLLHFPHKLLLILVLNVSSKTNVIVLVKPHLENCLKSVMHRRFHVQCRRISMLYGQTFCCGRFIDDVQVRDSVLSWQDYRHCCEISFPMSMKDLSKSSHLYSFVLTSQTVTNDAYWLKKLIITESDIYVTF